MGLEDTFQDYYNRFEGILEQLSSKPAAGGLQITDSAVQYVSISEEGSPFYFSVRLPPGAVQNGRIESKEKFVAALQKLYGQVAAEREEEREKVVVSLPSNVAYTQNFEIPKVEDGKIEETASLNLEMISPIPAEEAYMSWEIIEENPGGYALLGAFVNKNIVDEFREALLQANFHPVAIEPPSLSLSWLVNKVLGPRKEAMLVLNVSSDGIDLFLLKNGYIYFDYFKSWDSVRRGEEGGQISQEAFKAAITQEVQQVISFTRSRFGSALEKVYFVAPGMEQKVKTVVEESFGVKVMPLRAGFSDLDSSWYTALGAAIRATWDRSEDSFISLGTGKVETVYYREQLIDFIQLWRNIFAGALIMFILIFGGATFLIRTHPSLVKERLVGFNISPHKKELQELEKKAKRFNSLVESIASLKGGSEGVVVAIKDIRSVAQAHGLTINDLSVDSSSGRVKLAAEAPSHDRVVSFKDTLVKDSRFTQVNLPFSNISTGAGDFVSFNMGFVYKGSKDGGEESS